MDGATILIFVGTLAALAIAALAMGLFGSTGARRLARRAELVRLRQDGVKVPTEKTASLKREDKSAAPGLDKLVRRYLPQKTLLTARLARAGIDMGVGVYVALNLVCMVACGLVLSAGIGLSPTVSGLGAVAAGLGLPHLMVESAIARRVKAFVAVFPGAIDLIVRGVRSGLPVSEGIAVVGQEMPDPVGKEFRAIADAMRFGENLEAALWAAAARIDIPEFRFFVISLVIQAETGGNLAETLSNLSDILRKRQQMGLKIRAMASEARASAMILGALPFVMVGILFAINPEYMQVLFVDPRGQTAAGVGLISIAIGVGVMAKMVRFEI